MEGRKCDEMISITASQSFFWDGYFGIDKLFNVSFSRILFVFKFLMLLSNCQDKRSIVYVGCFWHGKEVPLP